MKKKEVIIQLNKEISYLEKKANNLSNYKVGSMEFLHKEYILNQIEKLNFCLDILKLIEEQ